jgi:hypothetical protein
MRAVLQKGAEVDPPLDTSAIPKLLHYAAQCNIEAVKLWLEHREATPTVILLPDGSP